MTVDKKLKFLRVFLVLFGLTFIGGLAPLMHYWPSGWQWTPTQYEYEQMIMGIYATLGIFLLMAVKNPRNHLSLIWFTVWSSVVHAVIMFVQVIFDPSEIGHLLGDVPALLIIAIVLGYFTPRNRDLVAKG